MTRTEVATYALIASAFVLGAMVIHTAANEPDAGAQAAAPHARASLLAQLPFESTASADFVVNKNVFTLLSASGISNEDFLYVLDNKNERLLCYRHAPSGRIELFGALDVAQNVQRAQESAGGRGNRGGRR
jgi:hypothetical protein